MSCNSLQANNSSSVLFTANDLLWWVSNACTLSKAAFNSFSAFLFFIEARLMSLPHNTHLCASQIIICGTSSVEFSLKYVFMASATDSRVTGSVSKVEFNLQHPWFLGVFWSCSVREVGAWSDIVLVPMCASVRIFRSLCDKIYARILIVYCGKVSKVPSLWMGYSPRIFKS